MKKSLLNIMKRPGPASPRVLGGLWLYPKLRILTLAPPILKQLFLSGAKVAIFGRLRPIWSFQLVQVGIWSATFFGLLRPFSAISHFSKLITLKNFVLTIFQSIISKVTKIISSLFALHQSTLLILM